jgi:hypothetical protein
VLLILYNLETIEAEQQLLTFLRVGLPLLGAQAVQETCLVHSFFPYSFYILFLGPMYDVFAL